MASFFKHGGARDRDEVMGSVLRILQNFFLRSFHMRLAGRGRVLAFLTAGQP